MNIYLIVFLVLLTASNLFLAIRCHLLSEKIDNLKFELKKHASVDHSIILWYDSGLDGCNYKLQFNRDQKDVIRDILNHLNLRYEHKPQSIQLIENKKKDKK